MSNRTLDQIDALATLKIAHQLQIEALTQPGLKPRERVKLFAKAAGFTEKELSSALCWVTRTTEHEEVVTPAVAVWYEGYAKKSLFANLPGDSGAMCSCPVQAKMWKLRRMPRLIPRTMPNDWEPSREVLEAFANIQQEARFGKA